MQFSHPPFVFFLTTLFTFILHVPVLVLVLLVQPLKSAHAPLILVPLGLTAATAFFTLLSNYLVRRARYNESQRVVRMLTDAAARESRNSEEATARALVGVQGKGVWGRFLGFIGGIAGLLAGLAALILVTVRCASFNLSMC